MDTAQPSELACLPQELQSHNDAQVLLLLQDYVDKLSHDPADTGSNLCLIAANRTPCRRNPRTILQSRTHGLLLPKQSTHPCRSPSQYNRTCSYKLTATAHASECATSVTSCPSRTSAEQFDDGTFPVKRIKRSHACSNAVELVISQLDRIEYNWLHGTLLLTDSLLSTAPVPETAVSLAHHVIPSELGAPMIRCLEQNYWADSECALNAVATAIMSHLLFHLLLVFHHSQLRHGVVNVCFEVTEGESSCHSAYRGGPHMRRLI